MNSDRKNFFCTLSYLSYGLGYGPFFPLIGLWVFRRDKQVALKLLQSFLLQSIFFVISLFLTYKFISFSYSNQSGQNNINLLPVLKASYEWFVKIILLLFAFAAFKFTDFQIPVLFGLSENLLKFFHQKKVGVSYFLTFLWPGLGHIYLNRPWLGWLLFFSQLFTLCVLAYLALANYNLVAAKDFLGILGFYFRIGDRSFVDSFLNEKAFLMLGLVICLNYLIAILNLPFNPLKFFLASKNLPVPSSRFSKLFSTSLIASYIVHLGILCTFILLPFIFSKSQTQKDIKTKAQKIQKQLEEQKKKMELHKNASSASPSKEVEYKELEFDLEIPQNVESLNDFSERSLLDSSKGSSVSNEPIIQMLPENKQVKLPERGRYVKKQLGPKIKSYSEYLTAKVREGGKDQMIWDEAPDIYSMVLRYVVEPDGEVSKIEIVEGSKHPQSDSMVISVVQSMSPLMRPPNKKRILITELFWNTGGLEHLDTELKKSLGKFPDGRVIEEI
jgi:hypothetical protein